MGGLKLPSPYLSRIKLEKELEKRARAIKEKRERAENYLKSIAQGLEILKNYTDVGKYTESYAKAKEAFEIKDFDKSLSILESMFKELTREASVVFENEEKKITTVLNCGKIENSAMIKAQMDEARSKLSSNFVEALKIMEKTSANLSNLLKDVAERRKRELLTSISGLENMEEIKKEIEAVKGEPLNVLDSLDKIEKKIENRVREIINEKIETADELINIASSAHYTLPVDEDKKKNSYEALENGDYLNATKFAAEYFNSSKDAFRLFFKKLLDISKILLQEGEAMEESMEKPKELLAQAEKAYEEDKLDEAVNLVRKATEEAEKRKLKKVLEVIKVARDKLLDGKNKGIDITPYLEMIEKARNLIKIGKHKMAYDTVLNAINMIERKINLYSQLKNEIEELKSTLSQLRKEDIILEGVDEKLEDIEVKVDENPEEAEKLIDDLKKLIRVSLKDIYTSLRQDLNSLVAQATVAGFDLRDVEVELENVDTLIEGENYKEGIVSLRKIEENLYARLFDSMKSKIENWKEYPQENVIKEIENVQKFIEQGEVEKSIEAFTKLQDQIFAIQSEKYQAMIEDMKKSVSFLRELGEDTGKIEEYIHSAQESLAKRNINAVKKYLEDGNSLIATLYKSIAERAYESARNSAEEASKMKIDLEKSGIIELLSKAEEALRNEKYEEVLKYTSEINTRLRELKEKINTLQEMMEKLQNRIKNLEDNNLPAKELKDALKDAEKVLENNEFEYAENIIKNALERADIIEIEGKIESLKREIEALGGIMKKFNFREEYLTVTKDFFVRYREKRYDALEEIGKKTIEKLKKSIKTIFNNYLHKLENMVEELQDLGSKIDTSPLRIAKEKFWEGEIIESFKTLEGFESHIRSVHGEKMELREIEDRLATLFTVASTMGIETDEYATKAKEITKIEDIGQRKYALKDLSKELEKKIDDKIGAIIRDMDSELDKMRRMGKDITTAESMLRRAENAIREGKYEEALNLILSAMGEIENLDMQKNTAYTILKIVENKIKKMRGLLPPEIIKNYKNARSMFLRENYRETIKVAMRVSEELWNIERIIETIKDRNGEIKVFIKQAKKMGIDMRSVLMNLSKAKKELQELHYERALKYVNNAYKEARRAIESVKSSYRERYEPLVKTIIEFNLREKFQEVMNDIEKAFEENDISQLESLISSLKNEIEKELKRMMDEKMKEFDEKRKLIESSPLKNSIDLEVERKKLENLRKEPAKFMEYYSSLMERIESLLLDIANVYLDEFLNYAKEYESAGINISNYMERVSSLRSRIPGMSYENAFKEIENLKRNFEVYIQEYSKEKMERSLSMLSKYSKRESDKFSKNIENALKSKDYLKVIKLADEALAKVGDYRSQIGTFNSKAMELKDLIKYAISLGLNMDGYIKRLKTVLSSPENLKEAIEKMDSMSTEIKKDIEGLKPKLSVSLEGIEKTGEKYVAKLKIKNEGSADANNINITLRGALNTENPVILMKLEKSAEKEVEAILRAGEGNKIHGEMTYRRFDGKEFKDSFTLKYEISKKGYHIEKNKEKRKCALCRGTILPGLDIVVCENCGAVYHLPCAKRAGKCVKCGTPFKFE